MYCMPFTLLLRFILTLLNPSAYETEMSSLEKLKINYNGIKYNPLNFESSNQAFYRV